VKPKYDPYGELRYGASDEDQTGFATYDRSAMTGLDYAQQRYYANSPGRFLSADSSAKNWDLAE
jgi:RHS repeat-associated protein